MANKVEDRVVAISFENKQFQANVTATLSSLDKLNVAIKNLSKTGDGFGNLEKSANKTNFLGINTALDKLKAKFGKGIPEADQAFSNVEKSSSKVGFLGAGTAWDKLKAKFGRGVPEADQAFSDVEKGANKVQFQGVSAAFDKLKGKFARGVPEADQAFSDVEKASSKTQLVGASSALDKLRGQFSRGIPEADQAFSGIERASEKVDFHGMTRALDGLTNKFSVLQGAAAVALGNIASQAAIKGKNFVKSFTFGPITQGFKEYETQLNAVQTILSNTSASGAKLKDVNAALSELNHYADKTIYNFTEMTKNIGTFTAAGVDLDTATGSIKGIANLAALSGSNAQQASTAMYQLSQAISAGRVSLQDWNSVVNAGMGGTIFQRALAQTAVAMGEIDGKALKLTGKMKNVTINGESFRNSIMAKPGEQSWLTGKVLTNTLQQLSGDLSKAQLKAQGFSEAQIKAIQAQAKMAVDAATKVKSFSQLLDTVKEAVGSGWAQTWQIIFGDFGEAKHLFTALSTAIGDMVGKSAKARNSMLNIWKDLGGRTFLIDTLKKAFQNLSNILLPIKQAFRDIFPKKTAADLLQMTTGFRKLVDQFKIGPETAHNLRRTFAGFFAVLDLGKQLIGGVMTAIKTLFGEAKKGSGGFLKFTGGIGDALVALDEWVKKGEFIPKFFRSLGKVLAIPIKLFGKLREAVSGMFDNAAGASGDDISGIMDKITQGAKPLESILVSLAKAWYNLSGLIYAAVSPAVKNLIDAFRDLGGAIAGAISQQNFDNVIKTLQTGLLGAIFFAIKKGLGDGFKVGLKPLDSVRDSLDAITGSLKNMQTLIKAVAIEKIAIALALLAASAVALSLVKPDRLASAMTAMAAGFGELVGTLALLSKVGNFTAGAALASGAFILLAGSMIILAGAVTILSKLSWGELAKGLVGIGGGLGVLVIGARGLSTVGPSLLPVGVGLMAISTALVILAGAMKIFATMKWEEIGKGLVATGVGLAAIGAASKLMGPSLVLVGPGLIAVGAALVVISGALGIMGSMKLETIGKGILAIAGSLLAIAAALIFMPVTTPIIAAGLVLVGVALTEIAGALAIAGSLKWETIGKGLLALGVAVAGLAIGLKFMTTALPGAAALLVAASAFAIFVPTLALIGNMKITTIIKGLVAMAASIAVLATVGAIAAPALTLLGLGIAGIGLGVYAVGKGVEMLAKAVILLGEDGAKGVGVLIAAFTAFIAVIPKVIVEFVKGVIAAGGEIAKLLPAVATIMGKVTLTILDVLIKAIPKIAEVIGRLIMGVVGVINKNSGPLINAGFKLLMNILRGIANHIGEITRTVGTIITRFLTALIGSMPRIIAAGASLLVKFLDGLTSNMGKVVASAATTIAKFLGSLATHIPKIVAAGANLLAKFLVGVANNLGKVLSSAFDVIAKFILGIANNIHKVFDSGITLAAKLIAGIAKGALKLVGAAFDAVMTFVHGIAKMLRENGTEVVNAGVDIAASLIEGVISGLASLPSLLVGKIGELITSAVNSLLGDELPKKFQEFADKHPKVFGKGAFRLAEGFTNSFKSGLTESMGSDPLGDALNNLLTAQPSLTPQFKEASKFLTNDFINSILGVEAASDRVTLTVQNMSTKITEAIKATNDKITEEETHIKSLNKTYKDLGKQKDDLTTKRTQNETKLAALEKLDDPTKKEQNRITHLTNLIKKEKEHITTLKERRDTITGTIAEENAKITANKAQIVTLTNARTQLNKTLKTEKDQLVLLAAAYDENKQKMDEAKAAVEEAKRTRDDYVKSTAESFEKLPNLVEPFDENKNPVDQLTAYMDALEEQAKATEAYRVTLDKLKALNLDDITFRKLVEDGLVDQKFAESILAGGQEAVDEINRLDAEIAKSATDLGSSASSKLYDAGVSAAEGVVQGFKDKEGEIVNAMNIIAFKMVVALKTALKIKSPSKVFAKLGKFSGAGIAEGLRDSSKEVTAAVSDVGGDAITALRDSMKQAFENHIDVDPTITPVLDLSQIKKDADKLAGMTEVAPITPTASYGQALSISAAQLDLTAAALDKMGGDKIFKFEQNNYSPTALSEAEIYRQTNNQLSQAKSALGLTQ